MGYKRIFHNDHYATTGEGVDSVRSGQAGRGVKNGAPRPLRGVLLTTFPQSAFPFFCPFPGSVPSDTASLS